MDYMLLIMQGGWTQVVDCDTQQDVVNHIAQVLLANTGQTTTFTVHNRAFPTRPNVPKCSNHVPVQHRDGKPAWCNECGLTESYLIPVRNF